MGWAHTYTAEANVLNTTCQNCHGINFDQGINANSMPADWTKVADHTVGFLTHASSGLASRQMMDKAEILVQGHVTGGPGSKGNELGKLCGSSCHKGSKFVKNAKCGNHEWMKHLTDGRVAESVFEEVSKDKNGSTCGW